MSVCLLDCTIDRNYENLEPISWKEIYFDAELMVIWYEGKLKIHFCFNKMKIYIQDVGNYVIFKAKLIK
jgi:hypothetical protein